MDSYEQYEQDCERIRKDNETLLVEFEKWLTEKDLTQKTIDKHVYNVEFYINKFLLYEEAIDAADGSGEIGYFLGYWFIKKAMWSSKASIKSNAASLKKFYQFMLEKGNVTKEAYDYLNERIKEEMQEWLDTIDRYDDPEIEDMGEVWGFK
ncbi:MAG: recombinase [Bacillota bacterium]|nr:recombinase [Bacillota bacterium]